MEIEQRVYCLCTQCNTIHIRKEFAVAVAKRWRRRRRRTPPAPPSPAANRVIRRLAAELGLNADELASRTHIHERVIKAFISNQRQPTRRLGQIAKALDIPLAVLREDIADAEQRSKEKRHAGQEKVQAKAAPHSSR